MTGLTADADIEDSVDLFGKTASDLQEGIVIDEDSISGTVKYVEDYSSAYGSGEDSGNYLVLHFEVPDVEGVTFTAELVGGVHGPQTLDSDGICIFRVTDKNSQTIKVVASKTGYANVTKVYDLTGLTLASED